MVFEIVNYGNIPKNFQIDSKKKYCTKRVRERSDHSFQDEMNDRKS